MRSRRHVLSEVVLGVATLIAVLPIVWLLVLSVQPQVNVVTPGWHFGFTLRNFEAVFAAGQPYLAQVGNSIAIVAGTVVLCVVAGSLAGYSLSRLGWSRRTTGGLLRLATLV